MLLRLGSLSRQRHPFGKIFLLLTADRFVFILCDFVWILPPPVKANLAQTIIYSNDQNINSCKNFPDASHPIRHLVSGIRNLPHPGCFFYLTISIIADNSSTSPSGVPSKPMLMNLIFCSLSIMNFVGIPETLKSVITLLSSSIKT